MEITLTLLNLCKVSTDARSLLLCDLSTGCNLAKSYSVMLRTIKNTHSVLFYFNADVTHVS